MDRQVPVLQRASFGYLARHPWQLLLALTGICIGVAVMVAVDLANESSRRAFVLSMDAVNGEATHQIVAGPAGVDERLYVALRVEEGLRNLAPVVEGYVDVGATTLHLLGIDPFAERGFRDYALQGRTELEVVPDRGQGAEAGFEEDLLRRMLTEPGVVLLARETAAILGIEPGDAFSLVAGGKALEARVAGLLGGEGDNDASRRNLLIADIATAQQWLGLQGRLSRIDVRIDGRSGEDAYEKRIERIEAALPKGAMMLPAAARSRSVSEMSEAFMTNLTAMSLLALLIGVFLIYNSVSFAVVQRRSLIGVLRALGVTRSEAFRLVLFEALLLGVAGAAVGLLFGTWLGERLLALVSRSINDLYYVVHATDIVLDPLSMMRGFAIGVGATLLAALVPAAEAASFRPRLALSRSVLEARSGHAVPRVAAAGAAIVIAGTLVLAVSGTALVPALVAVFMLVFGLALAVPLFVRGASGLLAPLAQGVAGTGARLAVAGIARSLSRTGVAIVALAVAVSATIGVSIMVESFRDSVRQWLDDTLQSDIYVGVARGTLDPAVVDELLELPQVEDHSTSRRVWLETGSGRIRLTAIAMADEGYAGTNIVGVDPGEAWRAFEDGAVLVSDSFAWRHGVAPGDSLALPTPVGARDFPVAATYRSYDADLDAVLMSRATYVSHWQDPRVNSLGIYLAEGADVNAAIEHVRAVSRGRQALLVNSNRELRERSMQIFDRTFVITDVLYWLAVGVAAVGILSAMLALQLERAREFAVFRALGMTPGQLGRMVVLQTAFIGLLSGLAAIPLGLTMAWVLVDVINRRAFGWQMDLTISPSVLVAAVGLAVLTAVMAGLYPAWRAAGATPALAMREE